MKVKIARYNPEKDNEQYFKEYEVPYLPNMKVLDVLNYIYENIDSSLSYRWSCRAGQCGSCAVSINGKTGLACRTLVKDDELIIEPLPTFPIIKDLVVDLDKIYKKLSKIIPYVERGKKMQRPEILKEEDIKNAQELRECVECFACIGICPVIRQVYEDYSGPMLMRQIARLEFDPRDEIDRIAIALNSGLYNCTTCKNCLVVCPNEINIPEKAIEKLRALAVKQGKGLAEHKVLITSIKNYWNPWQQPRSARQRWAKKFELLNKGEYLFYAGCSPSLLKTELPTSAIKILKKIGINPAYLGKEERCCGSTALRIGEVEVFKEMASGNIEEFKKAGAKKIIVMCAGCHKTIKHDYKEYFPDFNFEVLHISEVLANAIKEGKLKLKKNVGKITYFDPCHLGRASSIYSAPRELIKELGFELKELRRNRENSSCCGSGGGVKTAKPELALAIGKEVAKMVEETNAEMVLSCCPWCETNISDSIKAIGKEKKVRDVVELVEESLE